MAAITQHRPHDALAGRRFGAFSGKTADTGSAHPVGKLIQHRPHGAISGRLFGSFAGKTGTVAPDAIAPQPTGELSHAWKLDPGWAAIWGPTQYGIPAGNRADVIPTIISGIPATATASGQPAQIVVGKVIGTTPATATASGVTATILTAAGVIETVPASALASGAAAQIIVGRVISTNPAVATASGASAQIITQNLIPIVQPYITVYFWKRTA